MTDSSVPGRPPARRLAFRLAWLPLAVALVAAATGCAAQTGKGSAGTPPAGLLPARVTRVVDGDTAVMTVDGRQERVRFIGVDTPESTREHEPYGEQSSAFTKRELAGRDVLLEYDTELRDRYGRLLAYVWLSAPSNRSDGEVRERQFNARLLLEGYAQQMTVPPNVKYVDRYRVYQREAREAGRGLWALP